MEIEIASAAVIFLWDSYLDQQHQRNQCKSIRSREFALRCLFMALSIQNFVHDFSYIFEYQLINKENRKLEIICVWAAANIYKRKLSVAKKWLTWNFIGRWCSHVTYGWSNVNYGSWFLQIFWVFWVFWVMKLLASSILSVVVLNN